MPCALLRAKLDFMHSTMDARENNPLSLPKGVCYVLFAYDGARSINLDAAERRIHEATQRQTIQHKHRAPAYLEYQPPPLRLTQEIQPIKIGGYSSHRTRDLVLYDFGRGLGIYRIP